MGKRFFYGQNSQENYKFLLKGIYTKQESWSDYTYKLSAYYFVVDKQDDGIIISYRKKKCHPIDGSLLIDVIINSTKYYYNSGIPDFLVGCIIHDFKNFSKNMCKFLNIDWFPKNYILENYTFNKSVLIKAINGTISNPKDIYLLELNYLKISKDNIPIKQLTKFLQVDTFSNYQNKTSGYQSLPYYLNLCTNPIELFKKGNLLKMKKEKVIDSFRMADKLGYKININWTYRRFREQHDVWVKILNDINLKGKKEELIQNRIDYGVTHIGDIKLITNEWELFSEGSFMRHCVGGYWRSIEKSDLLIGKYKGLKKNTVEIKFEENGSLKLGQMKKRYNHRPNDVDKEYVKSLIKNYYFDHLSGKIVKKEKILV